ncbi:hypothetical protein DFH27DRAFT_171457 [Peziza echinospora]|nr:hypothetical protein DFH27DRAFT_171457 [Peziza echinospora]
MTTHPAGPAGPDGEPAPPPGSFAGIVLAIYHDLIANALHEVVHEAHRSEKLLRTQQVQLASAIEAAKPTSSADDKPPEAKPMVNPMTVFPKEIVCPKCKLPRHTNETIANGIASGKEDKKKYCTKLPFQNKPLHDIYGNPFPSVNSSATQKKAKAAAAAAQSANENGDSSVDTPPGEVPAISTANGRKPDSLVYFKCGNCQQEKIHAPRFAAHLDKCLMLAGRKSSRTAMAKISGSGSASGAASPALASDSMVGTGSIAVGKVTGKGTSDGLDMDSLRKERTASFTVGDEGINVPPPPALPTAISKAHTPAPKKKKKAAPKDSGVTVPAPTDDSTPLIKEATRPSTPLISAAVLPGKDGKETPSSTKKRKRKPETVPGSSAGSPPPPIAKQDFAAAMDERDVSITVTPNRPKPPLKKQKTDIPPPDGALLKKNPISKFKDRDSPGPTPLKKTDQKRDSSLSATPAPSGKFPPSKSAKSPPPQAKAASPIPSKHPPSASPKPSPAKLGAGVKGTKKSTPLADAASRKAKPPGSANGTPKIAKKSLPGVGVNVPAPGKIAGKTLPKPIVPIDAAVPPPPNSAKKDMSPEKPRKPLTNGTVKAGSSTSKPKLQKASALSGNGAQRASPSKTVPGKTLPGKRAVPVVGFGAAGDRDPDGGIPRKRPKVGEL